jgi:hypothetical protein
MVAERRLRIATLVFLASGLLMFLVGVFRGGEVIWIGFAFLILASLLALWVKWGASGWAGS